MTKAKHYKIEEKGDFEIVFGSSSDCNYPLTDFLDKVSPRHAALKREGDRLFLRDLGSSQGTYIDKNKIGTKWHEITLHNLVFFGEVPLEIGPTLLFGRDRVGINANDIFYTTRERVSRNRRDSSLKRIVRIIRPSRRVLCNHISIKVKEGALTGIMGPSGSGKTVLLNLLSGYLNPEGGNVMVGNFNVHKSFGLIKDIIGHVPQDDTLLPELTALQSLHYCLRLKYPDMEAHIRQTLIEDVLERMGFTGSKLELLMNTKIGSPGQRTLSGGERKRVNIAHELVTSPLLLFLDEPTSGLSSVDSEHVIGLLKNICKNRHVTTLMTLHQPSRVIFNQLDQILLLSFGGNMAYFGSRDDAIRYFQKFTGKRYVNENPAEYLLKALEIWEQKHSPDNPFSEAQSKQSNIARVYLKKDGK